MSRDDETSELYSFGKKYSILDTLLWSRWDFAMLLIDILLKRISTIVF